MKANELRVGNYINYDVNNLGKIVGVISDEVIHIEDDFKRFVQNCKGIKITEELKYKINKNKGILIDKLGFVIFKNGYAYQFVFDDYNFLHQLQNLYFALTGEELIINENL